VVNQKGANFGIREVLSIQILTLVMFLHRTRDGNVGMNANAGFKGGKESRRAYLRQERLGPSAPGARLYKSVPISGITRRKLYPGSVILPSATTAYERSEETRHSEKQGQPDPVELYQGMPCR